MLSVFCHLNCINALLVELFRNEESPDPVGSLSNASQDAEEVAVAKTTLLDVVWLNFVSKNQ